MQAITKYQTTDGREFAVEAEAAAHQSGLDNEGKIKEFLDRNYAQKAEGKNGPVRSIAGKAIAKWLAEAV